MERIDRADYIISEIAKMLPEIYEIDDETRETRFFTNPDRTEILSSSSVEIEALANLFDQLYGEGTCITGQYDPDEWRDEEFEEDIYSGLWYLEIG